MKYISRVTSFVVLPDEDSIFSENATTVRIVDEAAGEFVEVEQSGRSDVGKICINPEEWDVLRDVIDRMIENCKDI